MADKYGEIQAALVLTSLMPNRFGCGFNLDDRPDLKLPREQIGVEVTKAMIDGQGESFRRFFRGLGCCMNEKEADRVHNLGMNLYFDEKGQVDGCNFAYWGTNREVLDIFHRKMVKLQEYEFEGNIDLYITAPFFGEFKDDQDVLSFMDTAKKDVENFERMFNHVYIFCQPEGSVDSLFNGDDDSQGWLIDCCMRENRFNRINFSGKWLISVIDECQELCDADVKGLIKSDIKRF